MNCINPIPLTIEKKNGRKLKIFADCGHCPACKEKRKMQWVFRLQEEFKKCDTAYFVTLTYDDFRLPFFQVTHELNELTKKIEKKVVKCSMDCPNAVAGVYKKDVQNFLKRLRKNVTPKGEKSGIKYFISSEYGPSSLRPHYHAIIFNLPRYLDAFRVFNETWQNGFVSVSELNDARINYTAAYCLNDFISYYDLLPPNFLLVSNGMGRNWSDNEHNRDYCSRHQTKVLHFNNLHIPLPRYYIDKIFTYDELEEISLQYERECYSRYYCGNARYWRDGDDSYFRQLELDRIRNQQRINRLYQKAKRPKALDKYHT